MDLIILKLYQNYYLLKDRAAKNVIFLIIVGVAVPLYLIAIMAILKNVI